jgi:hypothetical protein
LEAVLNFAEQVFLNTARFWMELNAEQKQRLQKVLFPQGMTFCDGIIGTAETCLVYRLIGNSGVEKARLATLTTLNLNQIIGWLREVDLLRQGQLACSNDARNAGLPQFRAAGGNLAPGLQTRQNRVGGAASPLLEITKAY